MKWSITKALLKFCTTSHLFNPFILTMSKKMRKWSDEYVQYGFTYITEPDRSQRPQCTIYDAKLSNSSLAPAKLKKRFLKMHGDGKYKNATLSEFNIKRARYVEKATLPVFGFAPIDKPILPSYEIVYLIAKHGKPHTIGEKLVKPAALKMANIMLGKAAKNLKFLFRMTPSTTELIK